jgi:hypothetical protein
MYKVKIIRYFLLALTYALLRRNKSYREDSEHVGGAVTKHISFAI